MAKTQAQIDKKKRDTEKRKKLEKAIIKIASEMPGDALEARPSSSDNEAKSQTPNHEQSPA